MNTKKINIGIWYVLLALFLVIAIMHPRIHFGLILIICFTQCISMTFFQKNNSEKIVLEKSRKQELNERRSHKWILQLFV